FAMAQILKAYLLAMATEPELNRHAADIVHKLKTLSLGEREASHVRALELQLSGNWSAAAQVLDLHNVRYPRDILALQSGHLIDFYRGSTRNLRDRIARILPKWSPDLPGYPIVLG